MKAYEMAPLMTTLMNSLPISVRGHYVQVLYMYLYIVHTIVATIEYYLTLQTNTCTCTCT